MDLLASKIPKKYLILVVYPIKMPKAQIWAILMIFEIQVLMFLFEPLWMKESKTLLIEYQNSFLCVALKMIWWSALFVNF